MSSKSHLDVHVYFRHVIAILGGQTKLVTSLFLRILKRGDTRGDT